MMNFAELREAAWEKTKSGWIWRYMLVWFAMMMLSVLVSQLWNSAVSSFGIQTWSAFLEAKARAITSGMDLTVPSRRIAIEMTRASAFEVFINCIVNGIVVFGVCGLFLRAAKGEDERWFAASFGGFRYPLGVAWLFFRFVFQITLWSMLFIVPGFVAAYRYCQCWNLKVEHPDWSAGKCLAESAAMMKGQKWRRFSFDCSYWKPITLVMLGLLALTLISTMGLSGRIHSALTLGLGAVVMYGAVVLGVYLSIGQALFYLGLKTEAKKKPEPNAAVEPAAISG